MFIKIILTKLKIANKIEIIIKTSFNILSFFALTYATIWKTHAKQLNKIEGKIK